MREKEKDKGVNDNNFWSSAANFIDRNTNPQAELVGGAAEYKIGQILADRGKYGKLHPETIIRTPLANIKIPTKALQITGKVLKGAGAALGVIGMVGTYAQYQSRQITGAEASMDLLMGGVGFIPVMDGQ